MKKAVIIADLAIIFIISSCFAATIMVGSSSHLGDEATQQALGNRWFEGDSDRVVRNMTDRTSNNYRAKVHPLFALLSYPATAAFGKAFGLSPLERVQLHNAVVGGLWIATIYLVLRLMGNRPIDSLIFSLLAAVSAASVFWFVVPETYQLGSLSILTSFLVAGLASHRVVKDVWFLLASAFSVSITVTNWMAGALATFLFRSFRRTILISAGALLLVALLAFAQKAVFPGTGGNFINPRGYKGETRYILSPESGGPLAVSRAFFLHSMVMPKISAPRTEEVKLSVQWSPLGSSGTLGAIATALWGGIFLVGLGSLFVVSGDRRMRLLLGLVLLGQLVLHLLYGPETFLYVLNFLPLLVFVAAYGSQTRLRWPVLVLACVLVPCAAVNNVRQLSAAAKTPPHGTRLRGSLDPRAEIHMPIGLPNTRDPLKTFVEPAGGFSPGVGSFGVSFWVYDESVRELIAPTMDDVAVQYGLAEGGYPIPWSRWGRGSLTVESQLCETRRETEKGPSYLVGARVRVSNRSERNVALTVFAALRPLGPAGGPVKRLRVSPDRVALVVDGAVGLVSDRPADGAGVSPRDDVGGLATRGEVPESREVESEKGDCSGVLRFDLSIPGGKSETLGFLCPVLPGKRVAPHRWSSDTDETMVDLACSDSSGAGDLQADLGIDFLRKISPDQLFRESGDFWTGLVGQVRLDVPDRRWGEAFHAIASQLSLVVNDDTPDVAVVNYGTFTRDGVYIINALQKAGCRTLAAKAIGSLLARPFLGRPYPEADNPGEVLWILGEQWRLTRDTGWLHDVIGPANELAGMIEYVRTTPGPHWIQPSARGFGKDLPKGDRAELKPGRCDGHHPEYTEAFDVAGLRAAALLAQSAGQAKESAHWSELADRLFKRYDERFGADLRKGYGSYSVLWPCRLYPLDGGRAVASFRGIGRQTLFDWPYLLLAKAHQGLLAGRRDAAHETIERALDRQEMRGWYALDEGGPSWKGCWTSLRTHWDGSVAMPHGWSIAEFFLLLRDSLAFEDQDRLVLLAGVPPSWFHDTRGIRLQEFPTHFGPLSFRYSTNEAGATIDLSIAEAPAAGYVLRLPPSVRVGVTADGKEVSASSAGDVSLPPHTKQVGLKFLDR